MSGQAQAAAPPARPLSPWAQRYGVSIGGDLGDGSDHSLLNPIVPDLDPIFYNDIPEGNPQIPRLDKLLHSRRKQLTDIGGIYSYQLGPLNEYLGTSVHGGHSANGYNHDDNRTTHQRQLLQVNEDSWLDIFEKSRWYTQHDNALIDSKRTNPITQWDPKSDRIWSELRIILEFCSRVLIKMMEERDPWLDTVLFGDMVNADGTTIPEGTRLPQRDPYSVKPRSPAEMPRRQDYFREARDRIQNLIRGLVWGFRDERSWSLSSSAQHHPHAETGWSWRPAAREGFSEFFPMIFLDVAQMRVLLERDPTPAEASIARFALANTILHELGHAIFTSRRENYSMDFAPEAYMGEEQIHELGLSFDNHVFGGIKSVQRLPLLQDGEPGGWMMAFIQHEFPNARTFRAYNQQPRDAWSLVPYGDMPSPSWLIPTFFCSSLFTQNYWDSVVNRKGTDALKLSKFHVEGGILGQETTQVDEVQTMLTQVRNAINARTQQVEGMIRTAKFDIEEQQRIWARSLWGSEYLRHSIALFSYHHSHHDLRDCRGIAQGLLSHARPRLYPDQYESEEDDPMVPSVVLQSAYWIILALGYLMHASLPAQPVPKIDKSYSKVWTEFSNGGKSANRDFDRKRPEVAYDVESTDGRTKTPLTRPKEYLDVIRTSIIPELAKVPSNQLVHTPWAILVRQSYEELSRQLVEGSGGQQWIDPEIRAPPYEPDDRLSSAPDAWSRIQPARPGDYTEGFSPDELFLTPLQIYQQNLMLLKTSTSQGWSCYEIYDDIDIQSLRNATTRTMYGLALKDDDNDDAKKLRPEIRAHGPMGVLMPYYKQCEVAEFDGSPSIPLWRVHNGRVYNITNVLNDSSIPMATKNAVRGPRPIEMDGRLLSSDIIQALSPYQCGFMRPDDNATAGFPKVNSLVLTEKELAHYDTPETGVYVACDGIIYDIGSYIAHHPGPIARYSGSDITDAYNGSMFHEKPMTEIDVGPAKHTIHEVGRLVPEQARVGSNRVALHGYMFDLIDLTIDEEVQARWAGKAVTAEEWKDSPDARYLDALYESRSEKAVAKHVPSPRGGILSADVRVITMAELAAHNQAAPDGPGAWVAVREAGRLVVYDISGPIQYPDYFAGDSPWADEDTPGPAPGTIVNDMRIEVAQWLKNNLDHRRVGELR